MANPKKKSTEPYPERPILGIENDTLDRLNFVERLAAALVNAKKHMSTGVVIGITGSWGSGKSSILNLLHEFIEKSYQDTIVVRFDPWLVSGRNDLIREFFDELNAKFEAQSAVLKRLKGVTSALAQYGKHLTPIMKVIDPLSGGAASGALKLAEQLQQKSQSLSNLRATLRLEVGSVKVPIVVLIDELDRIDDAEVHTIAQLVRSVLDFSGISYVLAYDSTRVVEALGAGGADYKKIVQRGQAYLEKIVQYQIPLPLSLPEELRALWQTELNAVSTTVNLPRDFATITEYQEMEEEILGGLLATPRDIKRTVGSFHVLSSMVGTEVDWIDLLRFSVLQIKAPRSIDRLRHDPELIVYDSLTYSERYSIFDGLDEEGRLTEFIDETESSPSIKRQFRKLFPKLVPNGGGFDHPKDRLTWRRPLLTTLRLGLLPGAWSKGAVEALVNRSSKAIEVKLTELFSSEKIDAFTDRLSEVYDEISIKNPPDLWIAISKSIASHVVHCASRPTNLTGLVDQLCETLLQSAGRNKSARENAEKCFLKLEKAEDVILVSRFLWKHTYVHGLSGATKSDDTEWFLSRPATEETVVRHIDVWQKMHLSGALFPRLADLMPIYLMIHTGLWTELCRKKFLELIQSDLGALDKAVVMMFGRHYSTGTETIEKLCGADLYFDLLTKRQSVAAMLDPIVSDAIQRALQSPRLP